MRRRSVSCSLPPVEQLTVHDSAESLTSQLQSRFSPAGQQARQQRSPGLPSSGQTAQPSPRMLSPFQTYSAPAAAPSQAAPPETQSVDIQPGQQQTPAESGSGGSGRLDLSPAKTALDMSLLDVARLNANSPDRPGLASDSANSATRRRSNEPIRKLSAGEHETAAIVAGKAAEALRRSSRSTELEAQLEAHSSTEYHPPQDAVIAVGKQQSGKPHRWPPLPLKRASSPLSVHGSDSFGSGSMPRQMSLHLPESSGPRGQGHRQHSPSALSQGLQSSNAASPKGYFQGAPAQEPLTLPSPQGSTGFVSPFASSAASFEIDDDQMPPLATTAASLLPEGSVINMASLLPSLPTQQHPLSPRRLSPLAVASLAASLPQEISSSAAAALSAPMTALQPAIHHTGIPGITSPSLLPASDAGMQARSPPQQTGFNMSPAPYAEQQQRAHSQPGYRLPPQLQSSSLLLQLLPAGSAQSLEALMSRQTSEALQVGKRNPPFSSLLGTQPCILAFTSQ